MAELERMQSDVKRIEESINDELARICEEHITLKRSSFTQVMDMKERVKRTEENLTDKHEKSLGDLVFLKTEFMKIDKDFRAAEFYINKMQPIK